LSTDKRLTAFRKRWNIHLNDQEELWRFKNRVIEALSSQFYPYTYHDAIQRADEHFVLLLGAGPRMRSALSMPEFTIDLAAFDRSCIRQSIGQAATLTEVIEAIQALFWALEDTAPQHLDRAADAVKAALELSPTVQIRVMKRGDTVILYSSGAKLLDQALIDETLAWLERRPKAARQFEEALRIFLLKDASKYRNLLDNLRFSVEQLLRSVLKNRKNLEKQKEALLRWLDERGVHQEIINMYNTLLEHFAQYQNAAVKHDEAYSASELEFMIYLTGVFMRFLLELDRESMSA
jgi:tetratricopeptide (TPR) repeat protein